MIPLPVRVLLAIVLIAAVGALIGLTLTIKLMRSLLGPAPEEPAPTYPSYRARRRRRKRRWKRGTHAYYDVRTGRDVYNYTRR